MWYYHFNGSDDMKYKLVAADMDGTLLGSDGKISEGNLMAIKEACDKGLIFVASSGRPVPGIKKFDFFRESGSPAIVYNGAKIFDIKNDRLLYCRELEPEDAALNLKLGRQLNTTMCVWSNEQLYCNVINEKTDKYKRISGVEPILFDDDEALVSQGITKILWYDEIDVIQKFIKKMDEISFISLSYCTSNPAFLEFTDSRVSKAAAMEKLGEIYGISADEMIAIGDGENDLSMIEYAGLGVAMENASDFVKSKADYITDSNDNDGVAAVLKKFCI